MAETARRLKNEVEDYDLTVKLLKYRIAALQDGCVPPVLGAWVEDQDSRRDALDAELAEVTAALRRTVVDLSPAALAFQAEVGAKEAAARELQQEHARLSAAVRERETIARR